LTVYNALIWFFQSCERYKEKSGDK
jgi:hypothetical protein